MKKQQSGFTLIELIAVIVILGILAAVAVPRFANLQDAARQSAADGIAGGISSGSAINYATGLAADAGVTTATAQTTTSGCVAADANSLLTTPFDTTQYTVTGGTTYTDQDGSGDDTLGDTIQCTLTDNDGGAATFVMYYVP